MAELSSGPRVRPFAVRHSGSDSNSMFALEDDFSRDAQGRLVAPFSCFPPFRGESPFDVARGRLVITREAAQRLDNLREPSSFMERVIQVIRRKLALTNNGGEVVIQAADLSPRTAER